VIIKLYIQLWSAKTKELINCDQKMHDQTFYKYNRRKLYFYSLEITFLLEKELPLGKQMKTCNFKTLNVRKNAREMRLKKN
jgi:hypothetical protein